VGVVCVEIPWYGVCRVRPDTLVTCARYSCSVRVAWLGVAVDGRRRIKAQHLDHDGSSARAACLCSHGPASVSVVMLHGCDQALAGSTSLSKVTPWPRPHLNLESRPESQGVILARAAAVCHHVAAAASALARLTNPASPRDGISPLP